jgi:hypothetical protein
MEQPENDPLSVDPLAEGIARCVQPGLCGIDLILQGRIYFSYDRVGSRFDGVGGGSHGRIRGMDGLIAAFIAGRQHEGDEDDGCGGIEKGRFHVGDLYHFFRKKSRTGTPLKLKCSLSWFSR